MKKAFALLITAVLILCFTACSGNEDDHSQTAAAVADEENVVIVDPYAELVADEEISGAAVSCEAWVKDGETIGFVMRFSKKTGIDEMLKNPENVYYANVSESENKKTVIPFEDIQILPDITTNEYEIRMLYNSGKKGTVDVNFCLCEREKIGESLLFCAKTECLLP